MGVVHRPPRSIGHCRPHIERNCPFRPFLNCWFFFDDIDLRPPNSARARGRGRRTSCGAAGKLTGRGSSAGRCGAQKASTQSGARASQLAGLKVAPGRSRVCVRAWCVFVRVRSRVVIDRSHASATIAPHTPLRRADTKRKCGAPFSGTHPVPTRPLVSRPEHAASATERGCPR